MYTSLEVQFQDRAPGDAHTFVQLTPRGNKATSLIQCPLYTRKEANKVANPPLYLRVMNSINVKTLSGELSAAASLSPPPGSPSAVLFTPLVSAVAGAAAGAGGGEETEEGVLQ